MACSVMFDEIDAENQRRESEYRLVYDSYILRQTIHQARTIIRGNPDMSETDILKKLRDEKISKDAAMASSLSKFAPGRAPPADVGLL